MSRRSSSVMTAAGAMSFKMYCSRAAGMRGSSGTWMHPALKVPRIAATMMARRFATTTTRLPVLHPIACKCIARLVLKRSRAP